MTREEVEAVLGHEVGHVANGDMVTLTLIQGVVNTFRDLTCRASVGYVVDRGSSRPKRGHGSRLHDHRDRLPDRLRHRGFAHRAWFSRQREFRRDAASARYLQQLRDR
jgi:heat shock protein HtpX